MPRLVFTNAAQANLLAISDYIANATGNLLVAENFLTRLIAKCEELARLPGNLGRKRFDLLPDMRSFPFGNYVIFFRYIRFDEDQETFEVVHILEGHQDLEAYFEKVRHS